MLSMFHVGHYVPPPPPKIMITLMSVHYKTAKVHAVTHINKAGGALMINLLITKNYLF